MDWLSIDKETIFSGKDENGNRYLSRFLSDYKKAFNPDIINAGCLKCLNSYYEKLTKNLQMAKQEISQENSGYVLKTKYNGIPLKFGSRVLVFNNTITDKIAKELIKNHPKGKDLFIKIPEEEQISEELKVLLSKTREELDAEAKELGIEDSFKNKREVAEAILLKQTDPTE